MRRSASEVIRNLETRIAQLEKQAGPKGGPISFSYDGMEFNEGEDLLSQLNNLEDGYEYEDAYFDGENLVVRGTFSDIIRVKKKTYLEQMSELLRKDRLVVDTLDDPSLDATFEEADIRNYIYAGWFITMQKHPPEYDVFAQTADVGCYIAFDGKKWKADILWTGFDGGSFSRNPKDRALRNDAREYFNGINRSPFEYIATGNVKTDLKSIKKMMKRI